jgi:hypothetical protein
MFKTLNMILKHAASLPIRNGQALIQTCSRKVNFLRLSVTSYLIHLQEIPISGDFFPIRNRKMYYVMVR